MNASNILFFVAILGAGFFISTAAGKKAGPRFSLRIYLLYILGPVAASVYGVDVLGWRAAGMFAISILLGCLMECIAGYSFLKLTNEHLWKYQRLAIGGFTSALVMPLWGCAGILFMMVSDLLLR